MTGTISLKSTLPEITGDLTITGPSDAPRISIDGGGKVQLTQVASGATLNLQFLSLAHGSVVGASPGLEGDRGAIFNAGTLTARCQPTKPPAVSPSAAPSATTPAR